MTNWKLMPVDATPEVIDRLSVMMCKRLDPIPASFDEAVSPTRKRWMRYQREAAGAYADVLAAAPSPEPCVWILSSRPYQPITYRASCEPSIDSFYNPCALRCCYCGHPLKVVAHE